MYEILIATMIGAVGLFWYSTKTNNIAFQKLWAALGILLFAVMFLQASVMVPGSRVANETINYTYDNATTGEWELNQTIHIWEYEDDPRGEVISSGNLALFTIFGFVFFLTLIWFGIDYLGIGLNDFGHIVRRKRKRR